MKRELDACAMAERSLNKRFRKELWNPFVAAVKRYVLLPEGTEVIVPLDGTAATMLLAKLLQELHRHSETAFDLHCCPAAGLSIGDEALLCENADLLRVPLEPMPSLTAQSRLALADGEDAVNETTLASMLFAGKLTTLPPIERSADGMLYIRPLYCIRDADIAAWLRYNGLTFAELPAPSAERLKARALLAELRRQHADLDKSVFHAVHAVHLDTFPGWTDTDGVHGYPCPELAPKDEQF